MPSHIIGDRLCQAAVFIYKDDGTAEKLWPELVKMHERQGGIRGEWHTQRGEFLAALTAWNSSVDPANSFLCIYSHAGSPGVNCRSGEKSTRIAWSELAKALINRVQYLWLLGCKTQECMKFWDPLHGPVGHLLLATSESRDWGPFLTYFENEIDVNHIAFDDEMPTILNKKYPDLAKHTDYFKPGFSRAF
jgi:hypothetical protein